MAYMCANEEPKAIDSFKLAYVILQHVEDLNKTDMTWPAIHLGCIYAINSHGAEAGELLLPILELREETSEKRIQTLSSEYAEMMRKLVLLLMRVTEQKRSFKLSAVFAHHRIDLKSHWDFSSVPLPSIGRPLEMIITLRQTLTIRLLGT